MDLLVAGNSSNERQLLTATGPRFSSAAFVVTSESPYFLLLGTTDGVPKDELVPGFVNWAPRLWGSTVRMSTFENYAPIEGGEGPHSLCSLWYISFSERTALVTRRSSRKLLAVSILSTSLRPCERRKQRRAHRLGVFSSTVPLGLSSSMVGYSVSLQL